MNGDLPDHLAIEQRRGIDATSLLTVYVVLLIAIPSKLVFAPLGGAGTPAQVVGVLGGVWYLWYRVQRPQSIDLGPQPVRAAFLMFAAALCASYIASMIRPISDGELSTADLGLVSIVGWVGVVLVANDGITSLDRMLALLRRVSAMGGALAALGIVQFVSGQALTDRIEIPGLTVNTVYFGVAVREGFTRPAGTAVHPIEFGVVLTAILPIALVCAMIMTNRSWVQRWYPVLAIAAAIPLSISRSAILGTIVSWAVLLPAWPKRARRWTYLAVGILGVAIFLTIPGFLSTLSGLFTGIGNDASAGSRTGSYAIAWEFVQRSPLVGRGYSTFLPSYWILDNQYLGLLIETGIIGLASYLFMLVTGFRTALRAAKAKRDPNLRQVGHAIAAAIAALAVCNTFYDLLAFPMSAGILFLILGLSGAFLRLVRQRGRHSAYEG